jgi:hypothetical protein
MWTFATIGAWEATADEEHCLEFIAVDRSAGSRTMWNLMLTAYYHAGRPENRLGVGHTAPLGEPWIEGSTLDHIQVLWVLPIYEAERDFKGKFGLDALESRFEERLEPDFYLDPNRPSVVAAGELSVEM